MTSETPSLRIAHALANRLARHERSFGPWLDIGDSNVVEILARRDFDFLMIDGEHSPIDPRALGTLLPAAEVHGMATLYRAPDQTSATIKQVLDAGTSGIMLPMVETADQARAIVSAASYAPAGKRGIGPWRASGYYDDNDAYMAAANDATTLILQIESRKGLDNLDEIAAVDGFDVLYIGPADLAASLGLPQGGWNGKMMDTFRAIARAAKAHGKIAGLDLSSTDHRDELLDMGFSLFTFGSDHGFLASAADESAADMRKACAVT